MKVYYDYEREELMTEEEAREHTKEDILYDDYGMWEFIMDNYSYEKIMDELPRNFIDNVVNEMVNARLESEEHFCVRDF